MKKKFAGIILMLVMMITLTTQLAFAGTDDYPAEYKNAAKDALVDAWRFYNRECTSFVAWRLNSRNGVEFNNWYGGVHWGNADNWGPAARSIGITVDNTPAVGAVAWWDSMHVAWVEAVDGNNVTIEEYNNPSGSGNYKERTISASNPTGYIHIKDLSSLPSSVQFNADKTFIKTNTNITFTYGNLSEANKVVINFEKNGEVYFSADTTSSRNYTTYFENEGKYTVFVRGYYGEQYIDSDRVTVNVVNPQFTADKSVILPRENITFSYQGLTEAKKVTLHYIKDNQEYFTRDMTSSRSYTDYFENTGEYYLYLTAENEDTTISSNQLEIIVQNPKISIDKTSATPNETVTIQYEGLNVAKKVILKIFKDNKEYANYDVTSARAKQCIFDEVGKYSAYIEASYSTGATISTDVLSFEIIDNSSSQLTDEYPFTVREYNNYIEITFVKG